MMLSSVSLVVPVKDRVGCLVRTVTAAEDYFNQKQLSFFEIIVVPNCMKSDEYQHLVQELQPLIHRLGEKLILHEHIATPGKGFAIRSGFKKSKGEFVLFTDSDLPYSLKFFDRALPLLSSGYALVYGNRRLSESYFKIKKEHIRSIYVRHTIGKAFNTLIRLLFGIQTHDTQAGIKGMTRSFAKSVFERQTCPGFLFDLEIFLTLERHYLLGAELPVTLAIQSEKSTVSILGESGRTLFWLFKIWLNDKKGKYRASQHEMAVAFPLVWERIKRSPLSQKLFLALRWNRTPYRQMASLLPRHGELIDVGCGHGLLSVTLAMSSPRARILALDYDQKRVDWAKKTYQDFCNLTVSSGGFSFLEDQNSCLIDGIAIIDVLHYLPFEDQKKYLKLAYDRLKPGGVLVFRETDSESKLFKLTRFYEGLSTTIGITKAQLLNFRTREGWKEISEEAGFQVYDQPLSRFPFGDRVFHLRKPEHEAQSTWN